jgi:hypothetical protein
MSSSGRRNAGEVVVGGLDCCVVLAETTLDYLTQLSSCQGMKCNLFLSKRSVFSLCGMLLHLMSITFVPAHCHTVADKMMMCLMCVVIVPLSHLLCEHENYL